MHNNTCILCGCVLKEDSTYAFQDRPYCRDCLEEATVLCSHCGRRILRDEDEGSGDLSLCSSCYMRFYTHCSHCGRLLLEEDVYYESDDDDTPYCYDCHRNNHVIHGYYYKPEPIFYGSDSRYFGVELEVDGAGESHDNTRSVLQTTNADAELVYCKHDGSLDDGFEIVTHPMTLDFHQNQMPWEAVLDCLKEMGYRSHQTSTCGLHIHVNRDSLGDSSHEQENTIARILFFVEKHWEELVKFSRRSARQLDRWASRYGFHGSPQEILKKAKGGMGRYCSINLTNADTIEFRIFRGTLKYNTDQ